MNSIILLVGERAAVLDGLLEVSLIDTGNGLFLPQIGDEFTILTSLGGVPDEFLNNPVSMAAGKASTGRSSTTPTMSR